MSLKSNLIERSNEISFLLERELRDLDAPCSISDMMRRVKASRMPIENHLKRLLSKPEFDDLSLVKIGTYDVIYRRAKRAAPSQVDSPAPEPQAQPAKDKEVEANGTDRHD